MGYAQDAMAELHGDRMIDDTPPTIQAAYAEAAEAKSAGYLKAAVLLEVAAELDRARATHAPMNSHHEGYAVILEELDELWEVCKRNTHSFSTKPPEWATDIDVSDKETLRRRKREAMRKEAIQVAAMAIRFIEDICDK